MSTRASRSRSGRARTCSRCSTGRAARSCATPTARRSSGCTSSPATPAAASPTTCSPGWAAGTACARTRPGGVRLGTRAWRPRAGGSVPADRARAVAARPAAADASDRVGAVSTTRTSRIAAWPIRPPPSWRYTPGSTAPTGRRMPQKAFRADGGSHGHASSSGLYSALTTTGLTSASRSRGTDSRNVRERDEQLRDVGVAAVERALQVHAEVRPEQPLEVDAGDQALRGRVRDRPPGLGADLLVGRDRDPAPRRRCPGRSIGWSP